MSRIKPLLFACLGIVLLALPACTSHKDEKVVNLAIWGNDLSPEMIQKFTDSTGIKLQISNYSSNEELLAKIQSGAAGFDVAVPSDYMVGILIKMQLIQKLDSLKITHALLINPDLLKQAYDPDNAYSLPYSWSTAGIAVNTELYPAPVKSWKDLFENPAVSGKISLLDDAREVLGAALKKAGHSVNSTKPEELAAAKELLLQVKPRVKMFNSETIDSLVNKEVVMAHAFSSDALQAAQKTQQKIQYIIPEEGGTRAIDNLVILKSAQHVENALKLIDFLLGPEADKDRVQKIFMGPVLQQTKAALPVDLQKNPALFPPPEVWKKMEDLQDQGKENKLYEDVWNNLKTQ